MIDYAARAREAEEKITERCRLIVGNRLKHEDAIDVIESALRAVAEEVRAEQREQVTRLRSIQHGTKSPSYFEATPLVRLVDVLAALRAGAEKGSEK